MPAFWRLAAGGIDIAVRLTPKADRDAVDGIERGSDGRRYLKCRVRAVPEDGKANAALVRLLAGAIGVPRGAVTVRTGAASRLKSVRVAGDPPDLVQRVLTLADS